MQEYKSTARTVGVLFIIASVAAVVGGSLAELPLKESDYLVSVAGKEGQIVTGALLEVIQALAVIGIAVMLFPVLRHRNEGLALGFAGVRTVEGVLTLAGSIAALMVLSLSMDHGQAGTADVQALGDTLVAARDWAYSLGPMIMFSVSALILYTLLFQAKLVPNWLSIWGFIGGALLLVSGVLRMYGNDLTGVVQAIFSAPIGINEMVLAIWLIVKGFNPAAIATDTT